MFASFSGVFLSFLYGTLIFLAVVTSLVILFFQGKGDVGAASPWKSGLVVFGGSGGQDFIAKSVWTMIFFFFAIVVLISKMEQKKHYLSVFKTYMDISSKKVVNHSSRSNNSEDAN